MDFLNGKVRSLYFKYLASAFGSALITSVYSIVDMAMVGQYHGPEGTAALAVVAPVWNLIYSLGLLMGIGGSVLFDRELFLFFGADASTLELAMEYIFPVKFVIPCFLFTQTLAAYLRNDKTPARRRRLSSQAGSSISSEIISLSLSAIWAPWEPALQRLSGQ